MRFREIRHPNGVVTMAADVIKARHGFTTRFGGVSRGYLESLNLGSNRGDEMECVLENYRRLGEALGIDPNHMAFTHQVHEAVVRTVNEADVHTLGTPVPYDADGVVTSVPGLALICFTADCVPVLLCDAEWGVVGAIHCGWRGSVAGILDTALERMRALGAEPERVCAALGPAIGKCCFEVGPEVVEAAEQYVGDLSGLCGRNPDAAEEKYLLDLRGVNALRLVQLGLRPENIAVSDECTMCSHDKYWSHRYTKGHRGVQGAVIVL